MHKRIMLVVKMAQFVSDTGIILRGRWCDVIVLNVHTLTEDKVDDVDDMEDSF
jgi:hypothetical protein